MVKHGAKFDRAWEFDAAMLARLPTVTIQPTLEYDAKTHKLSGPLLSSVVNVRSTAGWSRMPTGAADPRMHSKSVHV